jgi:hypothetical protein
MKKEKKEALVKYQTAIKNKLSEKTPGKHESHPRTYKAFLQRELDVVTKQLDAEKLT